MKKSLIVVLGIVLMLQTGFAQMMREATPLPIGQTIHFSLDKDEQKDLSVQLGSNTYYLVCDMKRLDESPGKIDSTNFQLLKSNGSIVDSSFFSINELDRSRRFGKKFRVDKPFAARLRIRNNDAPLEYWITIVPVKTMKWMPFAFYSTDLKPLGIGPNEGKGGTLDAHEIVYHEINLPAGAWNVSLYLKRADGHNSNINGSLDEFDQYGFRIDHLLSVIELATEARQEKKIVLVHPQTLIFRVTNEDTPPLDYTIGIEKAEN